MPSFHRDAETADLVRPIRSATSASAALPSSAISFEVQTHDSGFGIPNSTRLTHTAPDCPARSPGNFVVRQLAQQALLLVGPPGTVVAGLQAPTEVDPLRGLTHGLPLRFGSLPHLRRVGPAVHWLVPIGACRGCPSGSRPDASASPPRPRGIRLSNTGRRSPTQCGWRGLVGHRGAGRGGTCLRAAGTAATRYGRRSSR